MFIRYIQNEFGPYKSFLLIEENEMDNHQQTNNKELKRLNTKIA